MDSTEKYIPVSQLVSLADAEEHTPLTWDFSLPPTLDTERLVVSTSQLHRIMGVAALRSIHVQEYQGDTTTATPEISGFNAHGVATASKVTKLQKADTQRSSMLDDYSVGMDGKMIMQLHGKTRALAKLNKPEIVSRVVDRTTKSKDREKVWASELNNALNTSIRLTARNHLIGREDNIFRSYWSRGYCGYLILDGGKDISQGETTDNLIVYATVCAFIVGIDMAVMKKRVGKTMLQERRWSITPLSCEQWDRYVATQALTRTVPLIKSLS